MRKTTSINVRTPQWTGSGLFRDLLAAGLCQWAQKVTIKNKTHSDIVQISKIPLEEAEAIVNKIRFLGAEIIE